MKLSILFATLLSAAAVLAAEEKKQKEAPMNSSNEVAVIKTSEGDIGKLLLTKAAALGADMIVMGAFHHSRWREFILGGVTLTMLEAAAIPLFMAH